MGIALLDRRQRFSFTWLYETPWFQKDTSWFKRNLLGNYQIAGTYIAESPQYGTPQSAVDANQNGDAAADRVIINTTARRDSERRTAMSRAPCSQNTRRSGTVGYLATDPNAQYIRAQVGSVRHLGPQYPARPAGINNCDFTVSKNVTFNER